MRFHARDRDMKPWMQVEASWNVQRKGNSWSNKRVRIFTHKKKNISRENGNRFRYLRFVRTSSCRDDFIFVLIILNNNI